MGFYWSSLFKISIKSILYIKYLTNQSLLRLNCYYVDALLFIIKLKNPNNDNNNFNYTTLLNIKANMQRVLYIICNIKSLLYVG